LEFKPPGGSRLTITFDLVLFYPVLRAASLGSIRFARPFQRRVQRVTNENRIATNQKGNNQMKTNIVPGKQINRAFKLGLACSLAFAFAAGQTAFGTTPLGDPLVPLGGASGFSLLVTDGGINSSDSAFQNGDIGLAAAGFTYAQSGGGRPICSNPRMH